ncbi:hypothetical protein Pd630_LPD09119 (plasmid) [Rhodococcus opacus PD630]|nr:hypothetical protein Pd630_LPD09119 [Rhodococcus opacus PD630]
MLAGQQIAASTVRHPASHGPATGLSLTPKQRSEAGLQPRKPG